MTQESTPPISAAYRGHLFCDLRGYTSFVERHGNNAALELLTEFRALVRAAVAGHEGAEVKTEGDSFYVVFPSASAAVMCGLSIVKAAAAATQEHPERPIAVGVGINAGEVVGIDDTFIGAAVNLAARVCSAARPGEVLVTDTVRSLTQSSVPARFASRGRPRLKGIREQVEVFCVVPEGTPAMPRRRPARSMLLVASAMVLVVLLAGAALVAWPSLLGRPAASEGTQQQSDNEVRPGPLDVGEYSSGSFRPDFGFGIVDAGWSLTQETTGLAELLYGGEPGGRLAVSRISAIYDDACTPNGYSTAVGPRPADLVSALQSTWFLDVSQPQSLEVDGRPGVGVEFSISEGVLAACDQPGEIGLFPLGITSLGARPGDRINLRAFDVNGRTVSVLMIAPGPDASVEAIENFFARAGTVVDSIHFAE